MYVEKLASIWNLTCRVSSVSKLSFLSNASLQKGGIVKSRRGDGQCSTVGRSWEERRLGVQAFFTLPFLACGNSAPHLS